MEKRKKSHKLLLIASIALLVIVLIGGYFYYDFLTSSSKQTQLSSRSREFLESQRLEKNDWKSVNFTAKEKRTNEVETVDSCFSLMIPFTVRNINTDENNKCYRYIALDQPRGSIVIFKEDAKGLDISHAPGLSMRRLKKDTYKEEEKSMGGKSFLVFQDIDKAYEKTAYLLSEGSYYVLTLSLTDPEKGDEKLAEILSSVKPL